MEMRGEEILSICVGTIHRPYCMQRFVNSVRANFPAIPIIVGSQDKPNSYLEAFFRENDVEVIYIQEDAGVGVARNATVAAARTEFVLICDDDFIFSSETKLEAPLRILAADKSIDIVGGAVTDIVGGVDAPGWKVRRWKNICIVIRTGGILSRRVSISLAQYAKRSVEFRISSQTLFLTGKLSGSPRSSAAQDGIPAINAMVSTRIST